MRHMLILNNKEAKRLRDLGAEQGIKDFDHLCPTCGQKINDSLLNDQTVMSIEENYLQWKLNLEIMGFVNNQKFYGWLNVYQSLTDLSVLYHLDNVVHKLLVRAGYDGKIKVASFIKSYYSIKARDRRKIENFDIKYNDTDAKKKFLRDILNIKTESASTEIIENIFKDAVHKLIFEFERDLDFKYAL